MPRTRDLGELARPLAALVSHQAGLVRRSQLRAFGLDADHVRRQIAARRWQLVAPEVVSLDNGRLDREQLSWRAVLHAPGLAWLGHQTALEHHGLRGWTDSSVHLLVPRDNRPAPLPGVVVHQSDHLPESPFTAGVSPAPLPVAPAVHAALSAASAQRWPRLAAALVIAASQQRVAGAGAMLAELDERGRVRHKVAMRAALDEALLGAESLAEVDAAAVVRAAGLPAPRRQVRFGHRRADLEVDLPDGSVLVLEVDGPHHLDPRARWDDAVRDAEVAARGRLLLRVPSYALRAERTSVVAALVRIRVAAESRAAASMGAVDAL